MFSLDEFLADVDDFVHVVGGFWEAVDGIDAELSEAIEVFGGVFVGECLDAGVEFLGGVDEFVFDVGDIDDPGDFEAFVEEVAFDGVEDDGADHMSDVWGLIDGGPAEVHADFSGAYGFEEFFLFSEAVIDSEAHSIDR